MTVFHHSPWPAGRPPGQSRPPTRADALLRASMAAPLVRGLGRLTQVGGDSVLSLGGSRRRVEMERDSNLGTGGHDEGDQGLGRSHGGSHAVHRPLHELASPPGRPLGWTAERAPGKGL